MTNVRLMWGDGQGVASPLAGGGKAVRPTRGLHANQDTVQPLARYLDKIGGRHLFLDQLCWDGMSKCSVSINAPSTVHCLRSRQKGGTLVFFCPPPSLPPPSLILKRKAPPHAPHQN